jgi:hypothetical protein
MSKDPRWASGPTLLDDVRDLARRVAALEANRGGFVASGGGTYVVPPNAFDALLGHRHRGLVDDGPRLDPASTWNEPHLLLGVYHIWIDATGDLRIKSSAPTSDTDGAIVGTQS